MSNMYEVKGGDLSSESRFIEWGNILVDQVQSRTMLMSTVRNTIQLELRKIRVHSDTSPPHYLTWEINHTLKLFVRRIRV